MKANRAQHFSAEFEGTAVNVADTIGEDSSVACSVQIMLSDVDKNCKTQLQRPPLLTTRTWGRSDLLRQRVDQTMMAD